MKMFNILLALSSLVNVTAFASSAEPKNVLLFPKDDYTPLQEVRRIDGTDWNYQISRDETYQNHGATGVTQSGLFHVDVYDTERSSEFKLSYQRPEDDLTPFSLIERIAIRIDANKTCKDLGRAALEELVKTEGDVAQNAKKSVSAQLDVRIPYVEGGVMFGCRVIAALTADHSL